MAAHSSQRFGKSGIGFKADIQDMLDGKARVGPKPDIGYLKKARESPPG
jgi:hypothetical protein